MKNYHIKRSRPHQGYKTPDTYEIEDKVNKLGIKDLQVPEGIVRDLCNLMSYEYFFENPQDALVDPSTWPHMSQKERKYHTDIQEFLKNIKYDKYPGTPLEKAVMIAAHLASQSNGGGGGKDGKGEKDSNGEDMVEVFAGPRRGDPGQVAERMSQVIEKIRHMSEFENQALELNNLNPMQKLLKLSKNMDALITNISLKLHGFKRITVAKRRNKLPNHKSRKKRHLPFTHYGQIPKLSKMVYLNPLFDYKLATKQLTFREGYDVQEEKQILMMLIDDSGSMSETIKLAWRNAVLLNRCEAVARGDAELIVYRYETNRYSRVHVKTADEAMKLYKSILHHSPRGGGTNIEGVLKESIEEIHKMQGYKPDIMIVLDGQDHFDDMPNMGVTVHAIIIGTPHKKLEKFCRKTGGMFLYEDGSEAQF